jgi:pimeloyl-ACP methyl ester carboxylesterase
MSRQFAELDGGEVAYAERGAGPAALFVHGVLVNADLWRRALDGASDMRRCVAVDLPAHGASPAGPTADLSLEGLAAMLENVCAELDLGQVDLVANDTGGAVAQVFAARHPERIRTLSLTNCDVHENFPPDAFRPSIEMAARGEFGPLVAALASDLELARSDVGFGQGYQFPALLSDELLWSYLGPFVADNGKGLERFLTESTSAELIAVAPLLSQLHAPSQVIWGTGDVFFEPFWAERLQSMIPGVERVTEIADAMLFFPGERSDELVPLLRSFWGEQATVTP